MSMCLHWSFFSQILKQSKMPTMIFSLRRKTRLQNIWDSIDSFNKFNNIGLAKQVEKHELLEFCHLAAHLYKACSFISSYMQDPQLMIFRIMDNGKNQYLCRNTTSCTKMPWSLPQSQHQLKLLKSYFHTSLILETKNLDVSPILIFLMNLQKVPWELNLNNQHKGPRSWTTWTWRNILLLLRCLRILIYMYHKHSKRLWWAWWL